MRSPIALPIAVSLAALVAAAPLAAQGNASAADPQNPVTSALRQDLQRSQRILTAAAEAMPADKYGYKPTAAQMSFGQLVLHVAGSNEFMCAAIAGTRAPTRTKLAPTDAKATLVARLKESFDYCSTTLASVTDSNLSDQRPFFGGRTISKAGLMMDLAADWADHYGASAIYLRLNGILPPTAQRQGTAD